MIDTTRVKFCLEKVIEQGYVENEAGVYILEEPEDAGHTQFIVKVSSMNICVKNYDKKRRCEFLCPDRTMGLKKCVDHFILQHVDKKWILHMIEMKKSVGLSTWCDNIKPKFRSSYLNIQAFAAILGIRIDEVIAYTTYEKDCFSKENIHQTTNPVLYRPKIGEPAFDNKKEWEDGIVHIKLGAYYAFKHHKICLTKQGDCLVGACSF